MGKSKRKGKGQRGKPPGGPLEGPWEDPCVNSESTDILSLYPGCQSGSDPELYPKSRYITLWLDSPSKLAVVTWHVPSARLLERKIKSQGKVSSSFTMTMSPTCKTWRQYGYRQVTFVRQLTVGWNSLSYCILYNSPLGYRCDSNKDPCGGFLLK